MASCDLYPADFAMIARGCGLNAIRIEEPQSCGTLLDTVLHDSDPVLIEAVVDQFTPPYPAKVKASQAAKFAESLLRGEPNRMRIALTALKVNVRELV
jgi:pyruvate dehydrogenase (quinone)